MDIPGPRGRGGFWEAYRACTEENRVQPDRSPFYVNWARDFANFLPEKPLKERSGKDIEPFWLTCVNAVALQTGTSGRPYKMGGRRGLKANCLFHAATSVISSGLAIRFTSVPGYPNFHTVHQGPDLWAIRWNVSLCKLLLPSNDFCK